MRHRLVHRLAVAVPAAGVVVLLAASAPAGAAPKGGAPPGNPHVEGTKGKPVTSKDGGNPHAMPAPRQPTSPAPTTITTPSPPAARNAPVVIATKQSTASGGGKPCNGCAGNANGKDPPGQRNNPGDGNQGHSCDGNKGIGKGNPAHEGCTSQTTTPTTTTTTATTTPEVPVVLGETVTRDVVATGGDTRVLGVTLARGSLATTGGGQVDLTVLAFGLVGVGTLLCRRGRRA